MATVVASSARSFLNFLPAIIFVVGCFLAFATGTSWGTFGILIPIVVAVFENSNPDLMIISISACMAGAVCGDHCSPISDTTIMASAGAQCEHVNHVTTQLPYAIVAAVVSFISYIIAGFVQSAWIALPIAIVLMVDHDACDPRDKRGAERRIEKKNKKSRGFSASALIKIGATGFEPATSRPPAERATKLRHTPEVNSLYQNPGKNQQKNHGSFCAVAKLHGN